MTTYVPQERFFLLRLAADDGPQHSYRGSDYTLKEITTNVRSLWGLAICRNQLLIGSSLYQLPLAGGRKSSEIGQRGAVARVDLRWYLNSYLQMKCSLS